MVAGDHQRADARALRPRHRVGRLGSWRIDHADKSGEHKVLLNGLFDATPGRDGHVFEQSSNRDAEGAKRLVRQREIGVLNGCSALGGQRDRLFAYELARAASEENVRRALREDGLPVATVPVAVQSRHQFALGGKRNLANAWQPLVESFALETALLRRDEQRTFGG